MNFSSLSIIINSNKTKGLFKLNIKKHFESINLVTEVYIIKFPSDDDEIKNNIMNSIAEKCNLNPTNVDLSNVVSMDLVKEKTFNYFELEEIFEKFDFITSEKDLNKKMTLHSDIFGFTANFTVRDIKRIRRYIKTFIENFYIVNDLLRYINKVDVKIEEKIEEKKDPVVELFVQTEELKKEENYVPTISEKILDFLAMDSQCIGYLIDLILNYYQYYNTSSSISYIEDTLVINTIPIFINSISNNKAFILNLFDSIKNTKIEKANLIIKNLIKFIKNNIELPPININMCVFILFIYSVRHLLETHYKWIVDNLDNIILLESVQEKILNTYCKKVIDIPIQIKVNKLTNFSNEILFESIEEISRKYSYIKSIDQEKFANLVFDELNSPAENKEIFSKIGYKNLLNIENFLNNKVNSNELIQSSMPQLKNLLLKYNHHTKNKKIISEPFYHFLNYINNPVYINTINKDELPNNILKSFEVLKEILNDINFKKENNNTFEYYKILKKFFSQDYSYSNYLFLIFQIIIPYMYYNFKTTFFEDTFLNFYQI